MSLVTRIETRLPFGSLRGFSKARKMLETDMTSRTKYSKTLWLVRE